VAPAPWLRKIVDVRDREVGATLWAGAYFFCLLACYYALRPLRESLGIARGAENLPVRFLVTLAITIPASLVFSLVVMRLPRARFVPIVYRFAALNLIAFYLLLALTTGETAITVGFVFYSWLSVFNVFVISVFWSFLVDLFTSEQAKRIFGFIALGGTAGAMCGSWFAKTFAEKIGSATLLLVALVMLEASVQCFKRLEARQAAEPRASEPLGESQQSAAATAAAPAAAAKPQEKRTLGDALEGVRLLARSRYLLGIALVIVFYTASSTFLYFEQGSLVESATRKRDPQTAIFASLDFYANLASLALQALFTAPILRFVGVGIAQALLPLGSIVGFGIFAAQPTLGVLFPFQVFRRAGDYGLAKPARDVLYTVVSRRDKYLSKNLIDTFIYRANDALCAWIYDEYLKKIPNRVPILAIAMIPLCLLWAILCLLLGRTHRKMAAEESP
jgi:AAA family ATP:ADP antiporter